MIPAALNSTGLLKNYVPWQGARGGKLHRDEGKLPGRHKRRSTTITRPGPLVPRASLSSNETSLNSCPLVAESSALQNLGHPGFGRGLVETLGLFSPPTLVSENQRGTLLVAYGGRRGKSPARMVGGGTDLKWPKPAKSKLEGKSESQLRWESLISAVMKAAREHPWDANEGAPAQRGSGTPTVSQVLGGALKEGWLSRVDVTGILVRCNQVKRNDCVLQVLHWLQQTTGEGDGAQTEEGDGAHKVLDKVDGAHGDTEISEAQGSIEAAGGGEQDKDKDKDSVGVHRRTTKPANGHRKWGPSASSPSPSPSTWWGPLSVLDFSMLVTAYTREGDFSGAQAAFLRMQRQGLAPNVVACTALMGAHCRAGSLEAAEALLWSMEEEGPAPSGITYQTLLNGYGKAGRVDDVERIISALETGVPVSRAARGSPFRIRTPEGDKDPRQTPGAPAVETAAQQGGEGGVSNSSAEGAESADLDASGGAEGESEPEPNGTVEVIGETGLEPPLSITNEGGEAEPTSSLTHSSGSLSSSPSGAVPLDAAMMNILIQAYSQSGRYEDATRAYRKMKALGIEPTRVTFNTLIAMFARDSRTREAEGVLRQMQGVNLKPDVYTYTSLLTAYGRAGRAEEAQAVFRDMVMCKIWPTPNAFTSLIDAYGRGGDVEKAERVFKEMTRKYPFHLPGYVSVLGAYCKEGVMDKAENLLRRILHLALDKGDSSSSGLRFKLSPAIFNTVMVGYKDLLDLDKVLFTFERMLAAGIEPDKASFDVLIASYAACGDFDGAIFAYREMVEVAGLKPDPGIKKALLGACKSRGPGEDEEVLMERRKEVEQLLGQVEGNERDIVAV